MGRTVRVPSCECELPLGLIPIENVLPADVRARIWLFPAAREVKLATGQ